MTVQAIIQKLELAGYRFTLAGDTIRFERVFEDATPEEELRRLLGLLKARKAEALEFLRRRQEPHLGNCVCPDCLHPGQETPPAGADVREADTGPGPGEVALPVSLRRDGTCYACGESRWWVSVYGTLVCATCHPPADASLVARWVGTEAWPKDRSVPPGLAYVQGRVMGAIPPPGHVLKKPYRCDPPAGIPDPMDFRWDSDQQEWVLEPGWWRRLSGKGVAH